MITNISQGVQGLLKRTVVWDNHACMPLRPHDTTFLDQLERHKNAGVTFVSLNIYFDIYPPAIAFQMLATFRHWILGRPASYSLVNTVEDVHRAKRENKLAIAFDIEGGNAVAEHPGLIELFYLAGVRWMLIAYNKNNRLGGGCQDEDRGLTDYGRHVIDEMERVGMVLCCSHTGHRTAMEAIEYSKNPVIFSHSNPRALKDHIRNIPDDLMRACARSGGVVSLNGIGIFLGENDASTATLMKHIDYAVSLIGPDHVGLGLDYVFDEGELSEWIRARPDIYPPDKGYSAGIAMVEPERFSEIAEAMICRGYTEDQVRGVLGHNNLRVAQQVWK